MAVSSPQILCKQVLYVILINEIIMRTCLQCTKVNCIGEGICVNGMLVKITGNMFVPSLLFFFFAFLQGYIQRRLAVNK